MKLDLRLLARQIQMLRSQLHRADELEEITRLTSLLLMMQTEYIHELEKLLVPVKARVA